MYTAPSLLDMVTKLAVLTNRHALMNGSLEPIQSLTFPVMLNIK